MINYFKRIWVAFKYLFLVVLGRSTIWLSKPKQVTRFQSVINITVNDYTTIHDLNSFLIKSKYDSLEYKNDGTFLVRKSLLKRG